jgi:NAD(P)-dependent dehydrogenase (short-subunit alcohol dehydrogenase family)
MNKTAIVTGGNRNIGKETALALADKSVDVIITYNERVEQAEEAIKELQAKGVKATAMPTQFIRDGKYSTLYRTV